MTCRAKGTLGRHTKLGWTKIVLLSGGHLPSSTPFNSIYRTWQNHKNAGRLEIQSLFLPSQYRGGERGKNLDFQVGWTQTPTRTGGATWGAERGGEGHGFLLEADEERQGRDFGMTNAGAQTLMEGSGCHVEATTAR